MEILLGSAMLSGCGHLPLQWGSPSQYSLPSRTFVFWGLLTGTIAALTWFLEII